MTLGERPRSLSGGEAQRLKLASEMGKAQEDMVFVFDEPTIGLHPADVQVLLGVFQTLIENGATVLVIEHDLDVIKNAGSSSAWAWRRRTGRPDCCVWDAGGDQKCERSVTGRYIRWST